MIPITCLFPIIKASSANNQRGKQCAKGFAKTFFSHIRTLPHLPKTGSVGASRHLNPLHTTVADPLFLASLSFLFNVSKQPMRTHFRSEPKRGKCLGFLSPHFGTKTFQQSHHVKETWETPTPHASIRKNRPEAADKNCASVIMGANQYIKGMLWEEFLGYFEISTKLFVI